MSVKVAVRVRPFNQREKELQSQLCVDMAGQKTILLNLEDPKKNHEFTFDYSFWSHDDFKIEENGLYVGTSSRYADQKSIFDSVGQEILTNAWEGYHSNLFMYGQTGAGKTHSMLGYGANKGIVQMMCDEIFKRIKENLNKNQEYHVHLSMFEIYNGKVQDLSVPFIKRPAEGLKVREHKIYGVYVDGLSKHQVNSYEAIEAQIDRINMNRTVGATQMNATSSRAHTIIQIEFKQIIHTDDQKVEKISQINLVDLAGSEKVRKTGASGERLKEASNINSTLTVLGQVISALAAKSIGNRKNTFAPYRDSLLTRILQSAFGGNSKTLMLCAISPAVDNYDETLSTLRYANQFKNIKNYPIVNQSDMNVKIQEEKQEMNGIKQQLQTIIKQIENGEQNSKQFLEKINQIKDSLVVEEQFMEQNEDIQDLVDQEQQISDQEIHQEIRQQQQVQQSTIDNQFEELVSVKNDIRELLQKLVEKNQQSSDLLVQLNGLTQGLRLEEESLAEIHAE